MVRPAARFEVVAGKATGMSIIVEDELVVGRLAEGAGRLADDEEISRSHARVSVDERGSCEIEDLGSTNGTFVNALRISAPQKLSEGDTIELGATTLVVREVSGPDLDVPPPPEHGPDTTPRPELDHPPLPEPEPDATTFRPDLDLAPSPHPEPDGTFPPTSERELESPGLLNIKLAVDVAQRTARLTVDGPSAPVQLVFEAGSWQIANPPD